MLGGGVTREYTVTDPREAFYLAPNVRTVVNCSGLGFGDERAFIIRGLFSLSLFFHYPGLLLSGFTGCDVVC